MRENQRWRVSEKGGGGKGRGVYITPIFLFKPFLGQNRNVGRPLDRPSSSSSSRRAQFSFAFLPPRAPVGQTRAEQSGAERESMMQNFLKPFPGKLNVRCSIAERGVEAEGEERERDGERDRVYAHFSPFDS